MRLAPLHATFWAVTKVLIVPDLALERWPSMDRYASRLIWHMTGIVEGLDIAVAANVSKLTVDEGGRSARWRDSGSRPLPLEPKASFSQLRRYMTRYWLYPRKVSRLRGDMLHVLDHSYGHILLGRSRRPAVVTVHDLFPMMILKQPVSGPRARIRNWLLTRALEGLRRADRWIVATEWLKGEFLEWLGDPDEANASRIAVIPYGVDDGFFLEPEQDRATVREAFGIPPGAFVVLHVGSVGPRKNLSAVAATVQGLRDRGMDAWLMQIGGDLTTEQQQDLAARGISENTLLRGPRPEAELRLAYRAADVLLFPSHYEGFGLPVLEAMASGLPVITSGAGGLAEVAGDAAVLVNGREAEPYVQAVMRLADDAEWRSGLLERGLERAARFRWVEAAKRTVEVYRSLG